MIKIETLPVRDRNNRVTTVRLTWLRLPACGVWLVVKREEDDGA